MTYERHAILLQLHAAAPATLPAETLQTGLKLSGFDVSEKQLQAQLLYLADKALVLKEAALLDPTRPCYRLTATGLDYLQTQNLA